LPREEDGAGQYEGRAKQKPPIDILLEDKPRDAHGREAFDVQQQ
jgi:hypothetical protein